MLTQEDAQKCLIRKKEIVGAIVANTETQGRFIKARKMKGMRRILREREALLNDLAAVNAQLNRDSSWKKHGQLVFLAQEIEKKQQELLERSKYVVQEAIAERSQIAYELQKSKIGKQVRQTYVNPWVSQLSGARINEKR